MFDAIPTEIPAIVGIPCFVTCPATIWRTSVPCVGRQTFLSVIHSVIKRNLVIVGKYLTVNHSKIFRIDFLAKFTFLLIL